MKNQYKSLLAKDNKIEIISKKLNENGYLVINCIFARTGIQERYGVEINPSFDPYKLYKEYRSPEEVFKAEVVKAFKYVTITNDHPSDQLDSTNTKDHAVGFVSSEVEVVENSYLKCEITIYDQNTITDIEAGKVELSAGYLYSLLLVDHSDYDYIQTEIKPNHIAIVQAGRCGSACSLALDNQSYKGENMKKIFKMMLPDGSEVVVAEIEVSEESSEAVENAIKLVLEKSKDLVKTGAKDEEKEGLKDQIESKDLEIKSKDDEIAKLQADLDTKKDPVPAKDCKIVQTLAHDLASVMVVAGEAGIECKGLDSVAIKTAVITKYDPELALDGKSPEYIGYAFDNIAKQLKGANGSFLKALDLKASPALDEKQKANDEAKNQFNSKYGGEE